LSSKICSFRNVFETHYEQFGRANIFFSFIDQGPHDALRIFPFDYDWAHKRPSTIPPPDQLPINYSSLTPRNPSGDSELDLLRRRHGESQASSSIFLPFMYISNLINFAPCTLSADLQAPQRRPQQAWPRSRQVHPLL